ncbi:uncharacterized protein LOC124901866 [Homo sapiens]|uniref:uncharacterized protein LOC124901866 n=1 Tax=Homo sapiens TaxID=9606 RepID=UPI001FB0E912|nr:uncharacterized protein LOC124901866 [Homo sapiens]
MLSFTVQFAEPSWSWRGSSLCRTGAPSSAHKSLESAGLVRSPAPFQGARAGQVHPACCGGDQRGHGTWLHPSAQPWGSARAPGAEQAGLSSSTFGSSRPRGANGGRGSPLQEQATRTLGREARTRASLFPQLLWPAQVLKPAVQQTQGKMSRCETGRSHPTSGSSGSGTSGCIQQGAREPSEAPAETQDWLPLPSSGDVSRHSAAPARGLLQLLPSGLPRFISSSCIIQSTILLWGE